VGGSGAVRFMNTPWLTNDLAAFTNDVMHVRVEVLDKPSDAPVQYQLCLVPDDISVSPACTDAGLLTLTTPGVYEARQNWAGLANFGAVAWQRGIRSVMAVARRADGAPLDGPLPGSGASPDEATLATYLPMRVRVQAMAVPSGTAFPGWP
jgi:hypothetical protein